MQQEFGVLTPMARGVMSSWSRYTKTPKRYLFRDIFYNASFIISNTSTWTIWMAQLVREQTYKNLKNHSDIEDKKMQVTLTSPEKKFLLFPSVHFRGTVRLYTLSWYRKLWYIFVIGMIVWPR